MKNMLLLLFTFLSLFTHAQLVNLQLEKVVMLNVDNKVAVCGYERNGDQAVFKAKLYDKDLTLIKEFEKVIPGKVKDIYRYIHKVHNVIVVRAPSNPDTYYMKLNSDLGLLSENPITSITKTANRGLKEKYETEKVALPVGAMANKDSIVLTIDSKRKKVTISRQVLIDSKLDPVYATVWETVLDNYEAAPNDIVMNIPVSVIYIKQWAITEATENDVTGFFFTKEGALVNFKLDSKTGAIKQVVSNEAGLGKGGFAYNTSYTDPETGDQLIAVSVGDKIVTDFVAVFMCDKSGKLIRSVQMTPAEYTAYEPENYNFKYRKMDAVAIGKLSNGNYFINFDNKVRYKYNTGGSPGGIFTFPLTTGFSFYELSNSLATVNSNTFVEEDISKKATILNYVGTAKNGRCVVYMENDKYIKKFKFVDLSVKGENFATIIKSYSYERPAAFLVIQPSDVFDGAVVDDRFIYYSQESGTGDILISSRVIE